jgi:L-aspartate oxidase
MAQVIRCDYVVVGSGIAGLTAAHTIMAEDPAAHVCLLTKRAVHEGSTQVAQGGIAVAMDAGDTPQLHYEDTLRAGDGLCDPDAVKILVEEGPSCVADLIAMGARFDRGSDGFDFTREGAHGRRRILHAQDQTGREIEKTLGNALRTVGRVHFFPHTRVLELVVSEGRCQGCLAWREDSQVLFLAKAVVLATGGCGQVFARNTNPAVATGDGIALAFAAGCRVLDMEFVQFHPTAFCGDGVSETTLLLISEAVRGEGAILRNAAGDRFMSRYHPDGELASRDIVSRAIFSEMQFSGRSCVFLDLSGLKVDVQTRFPHIYMQCEKVGIALTREWIPVAPAAHYMMGGVRTDVWGQTDLPGLYAAGEVACLGVHGANRLASNSLLDGLVFGRRAARHALGTAGAPPSDPSPFSLPAATVPPVRDAEEIRTHLRELMWSDVGIVRNAAGLTRALGQLQTWAGQFPLSPNPADIELANLLRVAELMTRFALARTESRGAHFRSDFPHRDDIHWGHHLNLNVDQAAPSPR